MSLIQFLDDLQDKTLSNTNKYNSFKNFISYYDTLRNSALGQQNINEKQLSEHIFKLTWKPSFEKTIVEKHLYAGYKTLQRIDSKITIANFQDYAFLLNMLAYDLFETIRYVEVNYRKLTLNYDMGSRPDQTAREIFDVGDIMFNIGTLKNPANLYTREVIPVSIFLLRQTIEIYAKRMLGFHSITKNGVRANISTQIAWDFIKNETLKPTCRISLPVDIDIILKVENWTNYYIHTGYIPEIYLIENAIHFISPLIYPMNNTVRNYRNHIVYAGTSKIRDYNSVKSDFEKFVNHRKNKTLFQRFRNWIKREKAFPLNVIWRNETSIDATIINL